MYMILKTNTKVSCLVYMNTGQKKKNHNRIFQSVFLFVTLWLTKLNSKQDTM